jgi:Zn-dependent protease
VAIDPGQLIVAFIVLLFSLSVHEAAHAWTAWKLGDSTALSLGRVSLNPMVHIDPVGTILFPLVAMVTGVPVLGWAKPVPVSTRNLGPHWKRKFMAIAAAGPASNLIIAALAAIGLRIAVATGVVGPGSDTPSFVFALLWGAVQMNVVLAVFNMVPVPPLDGGNVLSGLLRGNASEFYDRIRPFGFLVIYGLMFTGLLSAILGPPVNFIRSVLL